jgi:hypothetical protein
MTPNYIRFFAIWLILLAPLRPAESQEQLGVLSSAPLKKPQGLTSIYSENTDLDKEPPCPTGRKKTGEAKYGEYTIRTYRNPRDEGCVRILKGRKLVFSRTGWEFKIGAGFYKESGILIGSDMTGKGKPNAVVSEWSGGAHCCFTFHIFELGESFKEISVIKSDHSDLARFVDLDHDGSYEFDGNDWAFAYWRTSFMASPAPRVVLKFSDGRYRLAYNLMTKPEPSEKEFGEMVAKIRSDNEWHAGISTDCKFDCGVPVALWTYVLELMYTGHPKLAWRLYNESWPGNRADKADFKDQFCTQLRSSRYWAELEPNTGPCPTTHKVR